MIEAHSIHMHRGLFTLELFLKNREVLFSHKGNRRVKRGIREAVRRPCSLLVICEFMNKVFIHQHPEMAV